MTRRKSAGESLIALGSALNALAQVGADLNSGLAFFARRKEDRRRKALQEETIILKNQLAAAKIAHEQLKQQVTANREIVTGLDIDKRTLEIRQIEFKQVTAGILPAEQAQFYKRPKITAVE